jgi:hypothetical protein
MSMLARAARRLISTNSPVEDGVASLEAGEVVGTNGPLISGSKESPQADNSEVTVSPPRPNLARCKNCRRVIFEGRFTGISPKLYMALNGLETCLKT